MAAPSCIALALQASLKFDENSILEMDSKESTSRGLICPDGSFEILALLLDTILSYLDKRVSLDSFSNLVRLLSECAPMELS